MSTYPPWTVTIELGGGTEGYTIVYAPNEEEAIRWLRENLVMRAKRE